MSSKSKPKKVTAGKTGKRKPTDDGKPKRNCSAFNFFMHYRAPSLTSFSPDNMRSIRDEWTQMDAQQRAPFERAAVADANRYRREKERWESTRVKRPCNAYIQFIKDFMAKNASNYDGVCDAVSAGAAQWKRMSDEQKAPWKKRASDDCKQYAAKKPTAKPTATKASRTVTKTSAATAKAKSKLKVKVAKPKVGKKVVKLTKSKTTGTRKAPKTIRKTKSNKTK